MTSYAALGLLPNIPLPSKSSSRSHKASLPFLPPHLRPAAEADEELEDAQAEARPKVGFGRIIRDADGNVVDIIIDEEPEAADAGASGEGMDVEDDGHEEGDEGDEGIVKRVEGKTDVVRCKSSSHRLRQHTFSSR